MSKNNFKDDNNDHARGNCRVVETKNTNDDDFSEAPAYFPQAPDDHGDREADLHKATK